MTDISRSRQCCKVKTDSCLFLILFLLFVLVLHYLGKAQQPQEQRYPFLSVCVVFSCVQTMVWLPGFGIFNKHTDGCTDIVRESALKVDSGRKIPCCTRDSNPCQYCIWLFGQTLYQLNYPHPFDFMTILMLGFICV